MAQKKVFLALACLAMVLATNAETQDVEFSDEQLKHFKEEIDKVVAEKKVTCKNYGKVCKDLSTADGFDFSEICEIVFKTYLCESPQDIDTVRRIGKSLFSASKEAVKTATESNEVL